MPGKKNLFFGEQPLFIHPVWLLFAWAGVQGFLLFHFGIRTELEPAKYIEEAKNLLETGSVNTANYWLYSVQIFLFAIVIKLKLGYVPVYLVQLLLNGFSTYYFHRFASKLFSNGTAFFITLILIFTIPIQVFTCILQTESIFFSLTLIFSCYLFQLKKLDVRTCLSVVLFMAVILFTRPTGLLFFPCVLLYLFFRFFARFSVVQKFVISGAAMLFFLFFLNAALGSGGGLDFMYPFKTETIICGVPGVNEMADIKIASNPNSIAGLWYYVTHNTGQFLRLAWSKSLSFFGLIRGYYSTMHNVLMVALIFPFYVLSIISVRWWWNNRKSIFGYCLAFIGITWLSVILTCDDWHNRFFFTILPYLYILSLPAIEKSGSISPTGNKKGRYKSDLQNR